ncbi:divalent-cation tolerance protein CutA [Candidatus Woesearchaeota archaeon]|nr:MAG: divalent-cation tolerance protein CutA [Candidatus Woesearchaeota archaeon]
MIFLYTPCKDVSEAKEIGRALVKKRLAACANIFPITSVYMWKEKLTEDKEHVLLIKTTKSRAKKVMDEIKRLHSYELPCIASFEVGCNSEYKNWVKEQVNE